MISHVCNTVLTAGLDPVVVVTGCDNELVTQAIPTAINEIIYKKFNIKLNYLLVSATILIIAAIYLLIKF